jgi:hypothetical protein
MANYQHNNDGDVFEVQVHQWADGRRTAVVGRGWWNTTTEGWEEVKGYGDGVPAKVWALLAWHLRYERQHAMVWDYDGDLGYAFDRAEYATNY